MEKKSDVRAIMARLQAGASTDETSSTPGGRPKQPLHSSLSSGSVLQRKPGLEGHSGGAVNIPAKPAFLKNTATSKSNTDAQETNVAKTLASRFENFQHDANINSKPLIGNKPLKSPLEPKLTGQKPPFNKPPFSATLSDTKPAFHKPPVAVGSKPSWVKQNSGGGAASNTSPVPPKIPSVQQKPGSIGKLKLQNEDETGSGPNAANNTSPLINSNFKPASNFRTAQNMFHKEKDKPEQADGVGTNKPTLTATNSNPPPKPLASKKPSLKKPSQAAPHTGVINGDAAPGLKRNSLPNPSILGAPPAKPNRPPKVNLDSFKRAAESSSDGPGFKKPIPLAPLTSHPSNHSNHMTQPQPPAPAVPSLPPRHLETMSQQEDFYDDVEDLNKSPPPPPLPPSAGHPSHRAKGEIDDDDSDGEMYEDLDERWETVERDQEKKKEKAEKEEKKRLEAEKKEQKEREKKEQDVRKKFKLVGPLKVIHQGKASADCKGSKIELALKQGDSLDIIRVQGNPEGKWLGRTADGSIGYVKTTSVDIDFNTLKRHQAQQAYEPEVYDDIDVMSSENSANKGPGVVLPPPPDDGGEIYDDCVDVALDISPTDSRFSPLKSKVFQRMFDRNRRPASTKEVPPPSQFTADKNSDLGAAIDEEIYDDVDSQGAPPPPPISSLPPRKGKGRAEEMDTKKQKKLEKEEKEFRKKFKYDGEIQVLYEVDIIPTLTNKKWGNKDLAIKAGEKLDVIVKAVDNKLICRNEDGKYGYVSTSYIMTDDGDIYDDIGDDCIYDND